MSDGLLNGGGPISRLTLEARRAVDEEEAVDSSARIINTVSVS